jgi:hypothetical protein
MSGAEAGHALLQSLGGVPIKTARCGPLSSRSALAMPDGEIAFLPKSAQFMPNRPVVGVAVTVRSIQAARSVLTRNRITMFGRPNVMKGAFRSAQALPTACGSNFARAGT